MSIAVLCDDAFLPRTDRKLTVVVLLSVIKYQIRNYTTSN
jgi:hypothetical protein